MQAQATTTLNAPTAPQVNYHSGHPGRAAAIQARAQAAQILNAAVAPFIPATGRNVSVTATNDTEVSINQTDDTITVTIGEERIEVPSMEEEVTIEREGVVVTISGSGELPQL